MKHHRQSEQKRLVNRSRKSAIRTFTKKAVAAAESGDGASEPQARTLASRYQRVAVSLIDKAAGSAIHKRTAARKKSRLAKRLNKATAVQA